MLVRVERVGGGRHAKDARKLVWTRRRVSLEILAVAFACRAWLARGPTDMHAELTHLDSPRAV